MLLIPMCMGVVQYGQLLSITSQEISPTGYGGVEADSHIHSVLIHVFCDDT